MPQNDKELEAISTTVRVLSELSDEERNRVLEYVSKRFSVALTSRAPENSGLKTIVPATLEERPIFQQPVLDIKTLRVQKKPASNLQMAVLVAYYLKELAPPEERKDSIDTADIAKYFTQAGFPLPTGKNGAVDTLNNARKGGYLDPLGNGLYKLNPVGFNLAAYSLPKDSGSGTQSRKKTAKKQKNK